MFFWLSKTLGALLVPPVHSLVLLLLWLGCRLLRRAERLRRWALWLGVGTLVLFSLPIIGDLLLLPLESAYEQPAAAPKQVAAIVLFAGATIESRHRYELSTAADRFVETLSLARRFPRARVIISGGSGQLLRTDHREAPILGRLASELGLDGQRLLLDAEARNTHENAVNAARLLERVDARTNSGSVLLVTSAFHMPRALRCLKKQSSRTIVPWPVDYRRGLLELSAFVPGHAGMSRSHTAVREYLGLLAYWLAGYV